MDAETEAIGEARVLQALRLTAEMFPGEITIEIDTDPDEPELPFVVFNVQCAGSPKEIVAKQLEWHTRVSEIPLESSGHLRLSVNPF